MNGGGEVVLMEEERKKATGRAESSFQKAVTYSKLIKKVPILSKMSTDFLYLLINAFLVVKSTS